MEQKLVQRCETEVVADACNASYQGVWDQDKTKYLASSSSFDFRGLAGTFVNIEF